MNVITKFIKATLIYIVCNVVLASDLGVNERIITQQRLVEDFSEVIIHGGATVYYHPAKDGVYGLEIQAKESSLKHIESKTENNNLLVSIQDIDKNYKIDDIVIYLRAPFLEVITLRGSVNFSSKESKMIVGSLEINTFGQSNVELEIDADSIAANLHGKSNFIAKGRAKEQEISIEGSGTFIGTKLHGDTAQIYIDGSGNCEVNVSDSIDITIKGMGVVFYTGSPSVDQTIKGLGVVKSI